MSLMRCNEPGWVLCAMNDESHRRGVWMRTTQDPVTKFITKLEVCAGREGDDWYVSLEPGEVTVRQLYNLEECLNMGAAMVRWYYQPPKEEDDE